MIFYSRSFLLEHRRYRGRVHVYTYRKVFVCFVCVSMICFFWRCVSMISQRPVLEPPRFRGRIYVRTGIYISVYVFVRVPCFLLFGCLDEICSTHLGVKFIQRTLAFAAGSSTYSKGICVCMSMVIVLCMSRSFTALRALSYTYMCPMFFICVSMCFCCVYICTCFSQHFHVFHIYVSMIVTALRARCMCPRFFLSVRPRFLLCVHDVYSTSCFHTYVSMFFTSLRVCCMRPFF